MTNSDKSFDTVDEDVWSIYEKDIEEIVVDSYSEEDIEDDICIELSTKPLAKDKEYERRKNINNMYSAIQKILGGGDADEPRVKTLKRATDTCKQLSQEELQLKYETELLLQTNWKLKRRIEKLQKKKKRKTGPATISRRLSGPMVSSPVKTSPIEKRSASVDESKLVIIQNIPTETTSTVLLESSKVSSPLQKNPKRKVKKRSGLSEEEKEFYKMEEKLEDLLYEIDALWNDVNNDEEKGSEFKDKNVIGEVHQADIITVNNIKSSGPSNAITIPQQKEKIKLTDINKLIEPELNPNKHKEGIKVNNISPLIGGESSAVKNVEVFKITNLNKLLDPVQNPILKTCDNAGLQKINLQEKRSSTSGDESPRLVIDENPQTPGNEEKNNLNQRELDVMEALQAVDTLCLSLVSDEPTTSESHPMVVEIKKIAKPIEKTDVIAISDSDDETANSDIVCLE